MKRIWICWWRTAIIIGLIALLSTLMRDALDCTFEPIKTLEMAGAASIFISLFVAGLWWGNEEL